MNELIFNGKNFTEFNAYYATSNFLDGAAKDVQSVSVVGRSGDLQLSNNRYKNLSLKIRVYVTRDMEASMRAMRNYLESVHGYARVEISDQPNEFRMAAFKEMFAPDSYDSKVGAVDLTFDSMPQRFLKSGENWTTVSSSSSEISGNPVSISNPSGLTALTGLSVDIEPVQSGEGDPSPTNIRPITGHTSATVTRTVDGSATDYTIDLNGTVYGGTIDLATGVLTLTHYYWTDDGTKNWTRNNDGSFYVSSGTPPPVQNNTGKCNYAPYAVAFTGMNVFVRVNNLISLGTGWGDFYADVASLKAAFAETPLQVVYPLAEPTTVQLTPQQVSLLTGTNIISTDMSSLTVTIASPAELENPTLFESKPLIRVYGNGTLNVNDIYITVANSPYTYIDIDCELMDCYHGSNNANQYVSFSTTDYVTLRSGMNYFSYSGFTKVEVTPRWYEI